MASLTAIRTAVKTTLEANLSGFRVYSTVPEIAQVPSAVVAPAFGDFLVAMGRGTDTWEFQLHVLAPYSDAALGQNALDAYVTGAGSSSIRQIVFNNKTLGLANTDAHVAGLLAYGAQFESAAVQHIGATLRLVVHTPGTE